ncbi:hypothetical protein MRB53_034083 [Persea americana]|uniref:Uncharacterized protein n=1 Tax=Persea americana TaxID=3435 RepID=A0ACC2KX42_PERAE|nr:hypothetical protein MRB53_034083 [Persea americana]
MVVAAKSATNSSKTPQEDSSHRNPSRPRTPLLPSEKDNGRLSPSSSKKAQTQRNLLQIRVPLLLFFFFILHKTPISTHLPFGRRAQAFRPETLAIRRAKPSWDASPHHVAAGLEASRCCCCNASGVQSPLNSKPAEQCWPGRIWQANPLARSLDCTGEKPKAGGMPGSAVRGLQLSMIDNGRRVLVDGRIRADLGHGDVGWKALQSKAWG